MTEIRNCKLAYVCHKEWNDLKPVPEEKEVRYCADCKANVFLCKTAIDLDWHLQLNNCVALNVHDDNQSSEDGGNIVPTMGIPSLNFFGGQQDGIELSLLLGSRDELLKKCCESGLDTAEKLFGCTAHELEKSHGFSDEEVEVLSRLLASRGFSLTRV